MISVRRIAAVALRLFYPLKRSLTYFSDLFYFPLFDLLVFGFMSMWMYQLSPDEEPFTTTTIVINFVLWQIMLRGTLEMILGLLEEIWSKSLLSFFSTPLFFVEWLLGLMAVGVIKAVMQFFFLTMMAWYIFGVTVSLIGVSLIPALILCLLFGWLLGLVGLCIVLRWGEKSFFICYGVGGLVLPFCGVFYSLDVLPSLMQTIGRLMPITTLFEMVRQFVDGGLMQPWVLVEMSLITLVLLVLVSFLVVRQFTQARKRGLDRLYL